MRERVLFVLLVAVCACPSVRSDDAYYRDLYPDTWVETMIRLPVRPR